MEGENRKSQTAMRARCEVPVRISAFDSLAERSVSVDACGGL